MDLNIYVLVTMCILYIYFMTFVVSLYIVHLFCGCAAVVAKHTILRNKVYIVIVEPG